MGDNKIQIAHLERICSSALESVGVPSDDASLTARLLVRSEAEGAASHGLLRLPPLLERIRQGSVKPVTAMALVKESPTTAILDAADGIGQVAGYRAMELAIQKATSAGLGAVTVINGGNFGRAGHPASLATDHEMIGIAASNASPRLVPNAGMKPMLGNNPWAVAIPTGGIPVVVDMANSIVANGKIRAAKNEGQSIPEGWATDASGNATTDPAAALKGALIAFGGYKGWSLSLIVDMLTGVLSGGAFADDVGSPDDTSRPQKSCYFFLAINVRHFMDVEQFKGRSEELLKRLRAASDKDVRIPGENSSHNYAQSAKSGILVRPSAIKSLDETFKKVGLPGWDAVLERTK
jgi:L-2-hydroxycarboxylate dehydrogenase (NAD+)